ncbi:MAG: hypothetical protein FJZ89_14260 [Chloroflexi bacterium]|nr:hypothetical protein [Chloroflexota bacterium]
MTIKLTPDERLSFYRLAEFLGYRNPKTLAPTVTAATRDLCKGRCILLGPAEYKDFRLLADALAIILKHSELFLNGLQGADRTEAKDFLGKVQAQIKWQLKEGESRP